MNALARFNEVLAATPALPAGVAEGAYKKIRHRIILKNFAGVSSIVSVIAVSAVIVLSPRVSPVTRAPSSEIVEELQYVHDCVWGTDSENDVQYASVLE